MVIFYVIFAIIIIVLISGYFLLKSKINIYYPTRKDACAIMSSPTYLSQLNNNDIIARELNNTNLKDVYCDNVLSISMSERRALVWIITLLQLRLGNISMLNDWSFIKINKKIENGLPHTRSNVIILPNIIFKQLLKYHNNKLENKALVTIGGLLIHEKTHVLQKQHPKLFYDLYVNYWNFIKANRIIGDKLFRKQIRTNPDGLDVSWIFHQNHQYIWIVSLFNGNHNLHQVEYVGIYVNPINLEEKIFKIINPTKKIDLMKIPEFSNFFVGINSNYYHPNELSAEIFTQYYLNSMKLDSINMKSPAIIKFLEWHRVNNLKN